ncbi:zinc ABC transporter, periplasmic-binding protein ZnuA [Lachnospiraceae bacterium KM106-2]|nr:zinc ABC transporter, periplasmic-binding protein ZnuA [Lachnospiraceae bacterium KM106-2]
MSKMKTKYMLFLVMVVCCLLIGCGQASDGKQSDGKQSDSKRLRVVTTIFPYYDFVKQVAKDKVELTWLLPSGLDPHAYEPTPKDMLTIKNSDLFVYNGGDMEAWVPKVIKASDNKSKTLQMMDYVKTVEEVTVEGMMKEEEGEEDSGDIEYDEHIWTSPKKAKIIVTEIAKQLGKLDPKNDAFYTKNAKNYCNKLSSIDSDIEKIMKDKVRDSIVVGDKFPLRYLVDDYHIKYRAAFVGCSSQTEPDAKTLSYLINYVKKNNLKYVLHIENSNCKVANAITNETNTSQLEFNSLHTLTKKQLKNHDSYISIMKKNVAVLKQVLDE